MRDVKRIHNEEENTRHGVRIPKLVSGVRVDPGNEVEGFRDNHEFCRR